LREPDEAGLERINYKNHPAGVVFHLTPYAGITRIRSLGHSHSLYYKGVSQPGLSRLPLTYVNLHLWYGILLEKSTGGDMHLVKGIFPGTAQHKFPGLAANWYFSH